MELVLPLVFTATLALVLVAALLPQARAGHVLAWIASAFVAIALVASVRALVAHARELSRRL